MSDNPTALDPNFKRLLTVVFEIAGESPPEAAEIVASMEQALVTHEGVVAALEGLLEAAPAFRSKPVGAFGSSARAQQDAHIVAEDVARAALAKAKAGKPL